MTFKPYQANAVLLLTAVGWGVTFALVQEAISSVPTLTFIFWRFLVAFFIMAIIIYKSWQLLDKKTFIAGLVIGALSFIAFALQTFGLEHTSPATSAFVTAMSVVLVPLLSYFIYKERLSVWIFIGIILSVAGLWLLTGQSKIGFGIGEGVTLAGSLFFSLSIIASDIYIKQGLNIELMVVIGFGFTAVLSFLLALFLDGRVSIGVVGSNFWIDFFITVVIATVFAFWAQTSMQRFTSPTNVALLLIMEPLSAAIFSHYYISEEFDTIKIAGATLMILGIISASVLNKPKLEA